MSNTDEKTIEINRNNNPIPNSNGPSTSTSSESISSIDSQSGTISITQLVSSSSSSTIPPSISISSSSSSSLPIQAPPNTVSLANFGLSSSSPHHILQRYGAQQVNFGTPAGHQHGYNTRSRNLNTFGPQHPLPVPLNDNTFSPFRSNNLTSSFDAASTTSNQNSNPSTSFPNPTPNPVQSSSSSSNLNAKTIEIHNKIYTLPSFPSPTLSSINLPDYQLPIDRHLSSSASEIRVTFLELAPLVENIERTTSIDTLPMQMADQQVIIDNQNQDIIKKLNDRIPLHQQIGINLAQMKKGFEQLKTNINNNNNLTADEKDWLIRAIIKDYENNMSTACAVLAEERQGVINLENNLSKSQFFQTFAAPSATGSNTNQIDLTSPTIREAYNSFVSQQSQSGIQSQQQPQPFPFNDGSINQQQLNTTQLPQPNKNNTNVDTSQSQIAINQILQQMSNLTNQINQLSIQQQSNTNSKSNSQPSPHTQPFSQFNAPFNTSFPSTILQSPITYPFTPNQQALPQPPPPPPINSFYGSTTPAYVQDSAIVPPITSQNQGSVTNLSTIHRNFKPTAPPPFKGDKIDPLMIQSWIGNVTRYMQLLQVAVDSPESLHIASSLLAGDASLWYEQLQMRTPLNSWRQLAETIQKKYIPSDTPMRAIEELNKILLGRNEPIDNYNLRYNRLLQLTGKHSDMAAQGDLMVQYTGRFRYSAHPATSFALLSIEQTRQTQPNYFITLDQLQNYVANIMKTYETTTTLPTPITTNSSFSRPSRRPMPYSNWINRPNRDNNNYNNYSRSTYNNPRSVGAPSTPPSRRPFSTPYSRPSFTPTSMPRLNNINTIHMDYENEQNNESENEDNSWNESLRQEPEQGDYNQEYEQENCFDNEHIYNDDENHEINAMRIYKKYSGYNRVTPEQIQQRRQNSLCFKCGKSGHWANECCSKNSTTNNNTNTSFIKSPTTNSNSPSTYTPNTTTDSKNQQ